MRRVVFAAAVLVLLASCVWTDRLASSMEEVGLFSATSLPAVRFSELHYDDAGTDSAEAIEVSGPAGTDVTGWTIVLYNGGNGTPYDTASLSTPIPTTCGDRGVVVVDYPVNGIQNGSPDGIALVNAANVVVEFLSYEGTFTAVGGAARRHRRHRHHRHHRHLRRLRCPKRGFRSCITTTVAPTLARRSRSRDRPARISRVGAWCCTTGTSRVTSRTTPAC